MNVTSQPPLYAADSTCQVLLHLSQLTFGFGKCM